jgi:hypothetical protein
MPFMAVYLEVMLRLAGLSSNVSINDIARSREISLLKADLESLATSFSYGIG